MGRCTASDSRVSVWVMCVACGVSHVWCLGLCACTLCVVCACVGTCLLHLPSLRPRTFPSCPQHTRGLSYQLRQHPSHFCCSKHHSHFSCHTPGRMWLTNMDKELTPQLGELWSIELIANDNLESMWVLCSMQPEDLEEAEEQEQQEQGVKAAPAVQQQQQQPQQLAKQSQPQSQPQQQQPQRPGPQEQAPAAGDDYGRSRRSGSWEREQQQRQQVGEADGRRRSWERSEKGRERERSRGRGEVAVPGSSTIAAARDARDARGGSAYVPREQQNQQRGGGSGRGDWDRERERDRGHSSRDGLYDRDRVRERGGSGGGGGYGGPGDSAVTDRQRSLSRGSDKHSR